MFVHHLIQSRNSARPKTVQKHVFCAGVTDGRTDGETDGQTDGWTERPSYRDAFLTGASKDSILDHWKKVELRNLFFRKVGEKKFSIFGLRQFKDFFRSARAAYIGIFCFIVGYQFWTHPVAMKTRRRMTKGKNFILGFLILGYANLEKNECESTESEHIFSQAFWIFLYFS